ncbi:MAG: penicillin-binding protein activator [Alphaproteobacteria bacterium]|nr:penicillin-binding protein activator [Alphaproteobacteria bacterium]
MKTSLFLAACAAFVLAVGGCAEFSRQTATTVSPNPPASQTSTYRPYYQANKSPYGSRNAAPPRPENQQTPAPLPAVSAPAALPSVPQGKVKAAILLPLSGQNAALGQAMLNAAQQAVFDAAGTNFELQPRDTAGAGGAEEAAHEAVADGAQLIIGPLFAADVPAVKLVAQINGLQMLPLSTDTTLAEPGVYVMGLAPGPQVERVIAYAAAHGAHHFAALVPATPYGALVEQVFHNAAAQKDGLVIDEETYDPAAHDLADKIKNLAALRDQIDALFLPEGGDNLKAITDQLTAAGFTTAHMHVLGTGLWDVPDLARQDPLLLGGWYAAPDPATRRNFIAGYKAAYGQEPPRLATLAYDATALAAVLAKRGTRYSEAELTNPNGFAGLDGIFRLTPSGTVERVMAVNEVTPDGARVIDAPPTSFVSARK